MWTSLLTAFNNFNTRRKQNRDASDAAIAQGPSWRHRRRLIYGAYAIAILMIIFGAFTVFMTSQVGVEMVIGGVALLSIIVTAYTTSATYEDVKIWRRSGPAEFENPLDAFDTDNPDGI